MGNKKILAFVIAGLVLIALGVAAYFFLIKGSSGTPSPTLDISVGGTTLTSLDIETFPAGSLPGPGVHGKKTSVVTIGEIAVISGTMVTDNSVSTSLELVDSSGKVLNKADCVVAEGSGGFGCGFAYLPFAGNYSLRFYMDDIEAITLPFEVVE